MNNQELEQIGESVWNTYKDIALYLLREVSTKPLDPYSKRAGPRRKPRKPLPPKKGNGKRISDLPQGRGDLKDPQAQSQSKA